MSRKNTLASLWQRYLSQTLIISPETMAYVAALKARIDVLEYDNALLKADLKKKPREIGESDLAMLLTEYGVNIQAAESIIDRIRLRRNS